MLSKIKSNRSPIIHPRIIGATAQIAVLALLALYLFDIPGTAFIQGVLTGYSIVGNLFYITYTSKSRKEEK